MFKITFPNGETALAEDPRFIRVHSENCFILCKRDRAEGVAYKGSPFLFRDGTQVHEVDGGDELAALRAESKALEEQMDLADETAIELYEAQLLQEEINTAQDEALIEIYEMIGG